MTVKEKLVKAEEVAVNLEKLTPYELNRIAGYIEGLISAKQLAEPQQPKSA